MSNFKLLVWKHPIFLLTQIHRSFKPFDLLGPLRRVDRDSSFHLLCLKGQNGISNCYIEYGVKHIDTPLFSYQYFVYHK